MREYEYHAPSSIESLFELTGRTPGAEIRFLAGGTDLVPRISAERETIPRDAKPPMKIVYLGGISGLSGVTDDSGTVTIGALSTLDDLLNDDIVRTKLPALCEAIREMAGFSVRNTATIGGNIMNASPAADSVPALIVMNALFTMLSPSGERRIPASEFFTGPGVTAAKPGEVLVSIEIKPGIGKAAFKKLGRRKAETLSVVNAAAYVQAGGGVCEVIRIAVGSAAPTVVRCIDAERALVGRKIDEESAREACELVTRAISPIEDIRSSAWYRSRVAPVIAARAVLAAAGR